MNSKYVILLTGCVNPKDMVYTAIKDPDIRMNQYIMALRYYLEKTTLPIVFCENTMTRLSIDFSDIPLINERFEFITFDGNNFDKSLGKGYGECEIIDYAICHSKLIQSHSHIIKITGRITIINILSYVHLHNKLPEGTIQALLPTTNHFIDSRFIICPKQFMQLYFLPQKNKLNDSKNYYFENLLYDTIFSQIKYLYIPFISFPNYRGYSGSAGYMYKSYNKINRLYYKADATNYFTLNYCPNYSNILPLKIKNKLRVEHFFTMIHLYTFKFFSKIFT